MGDAMPQLEAIRSAFDDVYVAAEHALTQGDINSYITSRMQIWDLYDKLDKQRRPRKKARVGSSADDADEDSDLSGLLQHLASAQARLDDTILRTWNDEWNNTLQAYLLSNPHTPEYRPKRVLKKPEDFSAAANDPRYGLGNTQYTREGWLLARARLRNRLTSRTDEDKTETRQPKRAWWQFWRNRK